MSVLGKVDRQLQASDPDWRNSFRAFSCQWIQSEIASRTWQVRDRVLAPLFRRHGSREDLVGLTTQVNVAFAKVPLAEPPPESASADVAADAYTVDHTGNIVIINPRGHYHGFIKLPHDSETIRLTFQTLASQY